MGERVEGDRIIKKKARDSEIKKSFRDFLCQAKQKYKIQNIFSQNTPGGHTKKRCVDLHRTHS
jgi:hypothetical protein